jgi:long-chain fatty acid transport protein
MKTKVSVLALVFIFVSGMAMASGWRIPEQSVDSTAKAGANVASSSRADTAYYNPANMSLLEDTWILEADATWIHLTAIDYEDARSPMFSGESEKENFLLPTLFLVSPTYGDGVRFGLSVTAPNGLAKRWDTAYQKASAQEFSLTVIEVNPVMSYDAGNFSMAVGPRMIYVDATVKSDASDLGIPLSRNMTGDTFEWGWNVAASYRPSETVNLSATYRSNIDLDFSDTADLNLLGNEMTLDAEVSVPSPAVLALSVAFDVSDNLTVEVLWDRTFWSEYDYLDFNFSPEIPGNPFEPAVLRDWDDVSAYRVSMTWGVNEEMDLMAGIAFDESPAPTETVGFELPDSDAWLFSAGMQYKMSDKTELGLAALYDYKKDRTVEVSPLNTVYGEFTGTAAWLVTAGLNYKF